MKSVMLRLLRRITLLAYVASLQGCSDEPISGPLGGMQTSSGLAGSSNAGSGGGSGAAAAGSAGAGQSSAGAPSLACSSYADDPSWSLLVTIKNEMTRTLYLGQEEMSCNAQRLFEVEDGARTLLPALGSCRSSCETMMNSGPVTCPSACPSPSTVTLGPGQSVQVPWDGRFGVDFTLPQQCMAGAQATNLACVRAERVEANIYTFSAKAGTSQKCLEPSGNCTCTPSAIGGCMSAASVIAGTIITTELILKLEPGEAATNGAPPYIGLLFQEQSP
jgi:hypothetical protein